MFKKLLQPGESVDYSASGSWVRVDVGSRVLIQSNNGEKAPLHGRDSTQLKPFTSLTITNRHSSAEVVELRVSHGRIVASGDENVVQIAASSNGVHVENAAEIGASVNLGTISVTVDEVAVSLDESTVSDAEDIPVTSGSKQQIAAANPNRKELIIQASADANQCVLRVGGSTVADGRGLKLFAGAGLQGSITLETTAAVHVHNEGPDQVDIAVLEVNKAVVA